MFTTTSGAQPSPLYKRLKNKPTKARTAVVRLELQHGSIMEHDRFTCSRISEVQELYRGLLEKG